MNGISSRTVFGIIAALALAAFGVGTGRTAAETSTGTASSANDSTTTEAVSESGGGAVVAHIHLSGAVTEKPQEDPFGLLAGQVTSLKSLLDRLDKARKDKSVKALVLTYDSTSMGLAQMEEIHNALLKFRESGKPVYAQVDSTYLSAPVYALLSSASDLVIDPMADLWVTGLYGEGLYLKGLLNKIGVGADFLQFEQYKSAAEMFTRTEPSDPAKENMDWLFDSLYGSLTGMIAESRHTTTDTVRGWIDQGIVQAPEAASDGMVDTVAPRDQFLTSLKTRFGKGLTFDNRYGEEKALTVDFSNPFAFFSLFSQMAGRQKASTKNAVGLIYIEGVILPGYSQPSPFGGADAAYSGDIRHALKQAADDPKVKAVVLRVDSPGGSVLGSDVILRAVKDLRAKKPVVVSMGDVAASGGYYVSCAADAILADETTITASIGVIGGKLITTGMWNKLGVNWVPFQRGKNADFFSSAHRFTDDQRTRLHDWMESAYVAFKNHVVEGRGDRLKEPIDDIAGGRVFTGRQAVDLGLVDRIGGLDDAIALAAQMASITDYEVRVIPRPENPLEQIMQSLSGETTERDSDLEARLSAAFPALQGQDLAPLVSALRTVDPTRTRAILVALEKVEILRDEGVALLSPFDIVFADR